MRKKTQQLRRNIIFMVLLAAFFPCYFIVSSAQQSTEQELKNVEEIAMTLQSLTQYEIDGSFLVTQCMENVNNQELKDKLIKIKNEYEDNIKKLSDLIRKYGREAPLHSRDFKGFFMQGYAAMRGGLTDQGAMEALHTNSQTILKAFETALNSPLPTDVKEPIQKIYEKKKKTHEHIDPKTKR